jgi:predicted transcriptional regulator
MVGRVSDPGSVVISVHKKYADAILDGSKTVELRRRFPDLPPGTKIWVYATKPVGAIVGYAVLKGIDRASPSEIWNKYASRTGIDAEAYDSYFADVEAAAALILANARSVRQISLDQLRDMRMNFHPPQIVASLSPDEDRLLTQLVRR